MASMDDQDNASSASDDTLIPSLPEIPQHDSRLFRLPPDIRLVILRLFLRFPRCYEKDDPQLPTIRQDLRTGLQLMQSCQILYREGNDVLHYENTICLHLLKSSYSYRLIIRIPILGIVDQFLHYNADYRFMQAVREDSPSCLRLETRVWEDAYGSDGREMHTRFSLRILGKYQRFEFVVREESRKSARTGVDEDIRILERFLERDVERLLFAASRMYRKPFHDKHLTIDLDLPGQYDLFSRHEHILDGCKATKYASININNVQIPEEMTNELKCREDSTDTFSEWLSFGSFRGLPERYDRRGRRGTFATFYETQIQDLQLQARRNNTSAYRSTLHTMLQRVEKWNQKWWTEELQKLVRRAQGVQEVVKKMHQGPNIPRELIDNEDEQFPGNLLVEEAVQINSREFKDDNETSDCDFQMDSDDQGYDDSWSDYAASGAVFSDVTAAASEQGA